MKTIILFPIVLIIVVYIAAGQVIPRLRDASNIVTQNKIQEVEKVKQEEQISRIVSFADSLERRSGEIEFLKEYAPKDPAEQEIINTVSQFATKHNVILSELSLANSDSSRRGTVSGSVEGVGSVASSISVVGEYSDIISFLRDTFHMKRLNSFNVMSLEKGENASNELGEEIQNDNLTLTISFDYGYLTNIPQVVVADIDNIIELNDIGAISQIMENVNDIDSVVSERDNPFKP